MLRALNVVNFLLESLVATVFSLKIRLSLKNRAKSDLRYPSQLYFFPYGTPSCRLQHRALGVTVGALEGNLAERDRSFFPALVEIPRAGEADSAGVLEFESLAHLLDYLENHVGQDPTLSRGILDEFMRTCTLEQIFESHIISQSFLDRASECIDQAREIASGARAFVLADSSYLTNRALIWAANQASVPSWIFNPDGMWLRVSPNHDESFRNPSITSVRRQLAESSDLVSRSEHFLRTKLQDEEFLNPSTNAELTAPRLPSHLKGKKILCFHAFRDASNLPIHGVNPNRRSLFRTFFEWADETLSIVSEAPHQWAIRSHPEAKYYDGDPEILEGLLRKHGLTGIDRTDDVPTLSLIMNKAPIYTLSGTIALETAAWGYKANVSSTRFPPELVSFSQSLEDFQESLRADFADAALPVEIADNREIAAFLLMDYYQQATRVFAPSFGQASRRTPLIFQRDLMRQQLSLLTRVLSRSGVEILEFQAEELLKESGRGPSFLPVKSEVH